MAAKTELENILDSIIALFNQYSFREEPHDKLSKCELGSLVKDQLPMCLQKKKDPRSIDQLFKETDQDGDGEVSFVEFVALLSSVLLQEFNDANLGH